MPKPAHRTTPEVIPHEVITGAQDLVRSQDSVPVSPGRKKPDGAIEFCAGAALAAAGLELVGDTEGKKRFAEQIVTTGSSDHIHQVFRRFGWSADICAATIYQNDQTSPKVRKEAMIEYFEGLRDTDQ